MKIPCRMYTDGNRKCSTWNPIWHDKGWSSHFVLDERESFMDAVILAGGLSSRAKQNKFLLDIDGSPMLKKLIMTFQPYCDRIIVVTGHYKEAVEGLVEGMAKVETVYNQAYREGMFTSVKVGVSQVKADFFLTPGDYPILEGTTIEALMGAQGLIRVPVHGGRKGHPIMIDYTLAKAILEEASSSNLKKFRDRYNVTYIEVKDQGAITDVDTMQAYQSLQQKYEWGR